MVLNDRRKFIKILITHTHTHNRFFLLNRWLWRWLAIHAISVQVRNNQTKKNHPTHTHTPNQPLPKLGHQNMMWTIFCRWTHPRSNAFQIHLCQHRVYEEFFYFMISSLTIVCSSTIIFYIQHILVVHLKLAVYNEHTFLIEGDELIYEWTVTWAIDFAFSWSKLCDNFDTNAKKSAIWFGH